MKITSTIIISLIGLLSNLYGQPTFSNIYRADSNNIIQTAFGKLLIADTTYYISGFQKDTVYSWLDKGIIVNFNKNGSQLWTKSYGDTIRELNLISSDMFVTKQGYIANTAHNNFDGTSNLLFIDFEGNIIMNKNYSDTNPIKFTGITQDEASNFYLLGTFYYQYDSKAILIKTDSVGNEIWRKYYDAFPNGDSTDGCFANDIISFGNNEFILTHGTWKNYSHMWSYESGTWLIKIDSAGNVVNEYRTPNNRWILAHVVTKTKDNGLLFHLHEGVRKSNIQIPDYKYYGYVGKLDSNFQLLWEKRYGNFRSGFTSAKEKDNGEILLVGQISTDYLPDSVQYSGWLMALDANGDSLWQRKYHLWYDAAYVQHTIEQLEILDDGRLLMSGNLHNIRTTTGTDFGYWGWLIRTDSFGCIVPGCQLLDNTENVAVVFDNEVVVFPNPASKVVRFRFEKAVEKDAVIRVYSGLGQLVGQVSVDNVDVGEIDVSDFNSGVYFYGVYVEGVLVKQGQILVQR